MFRRWMGEDEWDGSGTAASAATGRCTIFLLQSVCSAGGGGGAQHQQDRSGTRRALSQSLCSWRGSSSPPLLLSLLSPFRPCRPERSRWSDRKRERKGTVGKARRRTKMSSAQLSSAQLSRPLLFRFLPPPPSAFVICRAARVFQVKRDQVRCGRRQTRRFCNFVLRS